MAIQMITTPNRVGAKAGGQNERRPAPVRDQSWEQAILWCETRLKETDRKLAEKRSNRAVLQVDSASCYQQLVETNARLRDLRRQLADVSSDTDALVSARANHLRQVADLKEHRQLSEALRLAEDDFEESQRTLELIGDLPTDGGKLRGHYQTRCKDLQYLMRKLQERLGLTETGIPQAEGASL